MFLNSNLFFLRINGCYEHLDGGSLSEALQDFTGGVCETIKLNKGTGTKIIVYFKYYKVHLVII